jgi:2-succinyl-6-hydroxy-2,4-cyclohexadiene-1-carboxylate synthase
MPRVIVNGVHLHVETAGTGPALLLLHGFTGSAATWAPAVDRLASSHRTMAVDLLGHGRSDAPVDAHRYGFAQTTRDLLVLLDALGIAQAGVMGYSMGGRLALSLAVMAPERVSVLILESTSPGLREAGARRARAKQDAKLAAMLEQDDMAAFVDRWEELPLFRSQRRLPEPVRAALRAQRLHHNPIGLANSLRGVGQGAQPPMHDRLPELPMPMLLIAGALDADYCTLGREMSRLIPGSRLVIVPDAGHTVHVEQPDAFYRVVLNFLDDVQSIPAVR